MRAGGGYWAGNLFGVWEQLKLGAYYRHLFCFITSLLLESFQHQSWAIGENHVWKSGISMWIHQSRSLYRKCVFNCASFAICHILKGLVVCVQHNGGSAIWTYLDLWVWFILMAMGSPLKQRGCYWPALNGPFTETSSPEALVWICEEICCLLLDHVDASRAFWEGGGKMRVHSGLVPFFLQTVTVTEVPPGFPLQTHFCFVRFVLFLSLLLSFFSLQTDPCLCLLPVFLFLVGLFFQDSAKAS